MKTTSLLLKSVLFFRVVGKSGLLSHSMCNWMAWAFPPVRDIMASARALRGGQPGAENNTTNMDNNNNDDYE